MENIYANAGKVISGERYVTRGGIEEKIKNRVLAGQATGSFSIMECRGQERALFWQISLSKTAAPCFKKEGLW